MIIVLGVVILVAAVIVGVAGVLTNGGSGHGFAVFGYHVTGSTGALFLSGIVVGAVGLFGLWLVLTGARRASRRGRAARRGLKQSRRETAAVTRERDDLIGQRDTGRADAASGLANPAAGSSPGHSPDDGRQLSPDEGRRPTHAQPAATAPEPMPGQSAPGIPADGPAPLG